jgi:hypothetical protein
MPRLAAPTATTLPPSAALARLPSQAIGRQRFRGRGRILVAQLQRPRQLDNLLRLLGDDLAEPLVLTAEPLELFPKGVAPLDHALSRTPITRSVQDDAFKERVEKDGVGNEPLPPDELSRRRQGDRTEQIACAGTNKHRPICPQIELEPFDVR